MQYMDISKAFEIVERLRNGLAANPVDYDGTLIDITASFGLTFLAADAAVEESVKRADKAMYSAKSAGRNCTCIWEPPF